MLSEPGVLIWQFFKILSLIHWRSRAGPIRSAYLKRRLGAWHMYVLMKDGLHSLFRQWERLLARKVEASEPIGIVRWLAGRNPGRIGYDQRHVELHRHA